MQIITHTPVSYTHLDVYKRQIIGIMIFLYSPLSKAYTSTSVAIFQMKENS